ncbi:transmembrane transport protein [Streptomyces griseoaurantiacus M045]|uniref:Transmembrane transport protein n=2 Tax=Streptomyces TaxID=1883 RepID=F3NTI2_9ACTN|nr:transmembrane transport protein [Streptomyces griseoaurantiacus M045]
MLAGRTGFGTTLNGIAAHAAPIFNAVFMRAQAHSHIPEASMRALSPLAVEHDARRDALYAKAARRIIPLLVVCYTFAYLDRVNIGFAKLQMQQDIGISEHVYGVAAGIFFLGYVIFEVPSNLWLARVGTRKTIVRIMILWGVTSAAMVFVHDATSFYALRFLLGVFEAGFAPGIIYYLTLWFPPARMAAVMSYVMLPGPIGSMVGGPLSSWIMSTLDGAAGLAGWQWVFMIEGLPCVLLGVVVWRTLVDRPSDAGWLTAEEKDIITVDIGKRRQGGKHRLGAALTTPRTYSLALSYFCLISGIYAVSFWLPTILTENGVHGLSRVGALSAVPYLFAIVFMLIVGRRSDRTGERRLHSAIPAGIAVFALACAAVTASHFVVSFLSINVAIVCLWVAYTVFWSIPPSFLKGTAAAGGIAFINSIGLLGGFFSPMIMGFVKERTGSTEWGLLTMSALVAAGTVLLLATKPTPTRVETDTEHAVPAGT